MSFFVPDTTASTGYGAETSVKTTADRHSNSFLSSSSAALPEPYDKNVENDILEGLSPFIVDAFTTVEEAIRQPLNDNKDSAQADPHYIQQQEQLIVSLTTARRALENEEYDNFKQTLNHLLDTLGIDPAALDTELRSFAKTCFSNSTTA